MKNPEEIEAELAEMRRKMAEMEEQLAAAQGDAGSRNATAETNQGNMATGDHARQVRTEKYVENEIHNPPPPEPLDPAVPARERYLRGIYRECNVLPLAAMGGEDDAGDQVSLEQVYIALNTDKQVPLTDEEKAVGKKDNRLSAGLGRNPEESRPVTALEAAAQNSRILLLGDPGSGKSTFVRQLAAGHAKASLGEAPPPNGWTQPLLPIFIVLHRIAPDLANLDLNEASVTLFPKLTSLITGHCHSLLSSHRAQDFANGLSDELETGGCLLILDGLDEMAAGLRPFVAKIAAALRQQWDGLAHVIVTCRIRSYHDKLLPGFVDFTLAQFDDEQINGFIHGWYRAQASLKRIEENKVEANVADLQSAALRAELRELAQNPMLLTTMAMIHQQEVGLPNQRVVLFERAVEVLMNRWQKRRGIPIPDALADLLADQRRLRVVLERLAYTAHLRQAQLDAQQDDGGDADEKQIGNQQALNRGELLTLLEEPRYLGSLALANQFLDYIDHRAGLLIGYGGTGDGMGDGMGDRTGDRMGDGVGRNGRDPSTAKPQLYSFPHRTFQEYLAGCHMASDFRKRASQYRLRAQEGDFWAVAARLGAEELYHNKTDSASVIVLAYELCPTSQQATQGQWRELLWSGHMALLLGNAEFTQEDDDPTAHRDGGSRYLERLRTRLLQLMRTNALPPFERADAGRVLARLGDPRIHVLDPMQIELCSIPAGTFTMGLTETHVSEFVKQSRNGFEETYYRFAGPQHPVTIDYDFQISRYPVTNAHFEHFVDAGGYQKESYWTEARDHGYWSTEGFKGLLDSEPRQRPELFGDPFGLANHPAVGVSWYEALAFTRWLTDAMHASGTLDAGQAICLPTEAQWEMAARGDHGGLYPWDGEMHPERASYEASGIRSTSAVGCFSSGVSPFGADELSGSVWEWTRSLWGDDHKEAAFKYPYEAGDGRENLQAGKGAYRILRGGFYGHNATSCSVASRSRFDPHYRNVSIGFRICVVPIHSAL